MCLSSICPYCVSASSVWCISVGRDLVKPGSVSLTAPSQQHVFPRRETHSLFFFKSAQTIWSGAGPSLPHVCYSWAKPWSRNVYQIASNSHAKCGTRWTLCPWRRADSSHRPVHTVLNHIKFSNLSGFENRTVFDIPLMNSVTVRERLCGVA